MKKILLILVVLLLAVPVSAAITVSVVDNEDLTGDIDYDMTGETGTQRVRAWALTITVDSGATITDVVAGYSGENTGTGPGQQGFGIFPGTINISGGVIIDPCTPVAPDTDPGAEGTGLDTDTVILEMGSLYAGANIPADIGTLAVITVSDDCNVTIDAEVTYRGGIVREVATQYAASSPLATGRITDAAPLSCRERLTPTEQALFDRYVADGNSPEDIWCRQFHCRGDGDDAEQFDMMLGWMRIYSDDYNYVANNWKRTPETHADPTADYDHAEQFDMMLGWVSVYVNDYNRVAASWKKTTGELTDCPEYIAP